MATRYCPKCRQTIQESDRFCTSCGATLSLTPQPSQATPQPSQAASSTGKPPRRWLKWGGIGCGGLVALVVFMIVLGAIFGGNGEENENPDSSSSPTQLTPIDPLVIWNDYLRNETRANNTWKGEWLALRVGPIDEIEDGGKVRVYMDEIGWDHIELDFKNDIDVFDLDIGDTVIAICKLSGFELDSWLNFKDYSYPE